MNRPLTYLSAVVCFAAGTVGSSFAAPSGESAPVDANRASVASSLQFVESVPSLTASEVIRSTFDRGFATSESSHEMSQTSDWQVGTDTTAYANTRLTIDVSEFISPQWRKNDAFASISPESSTEGEALPFAQPAMFTSSDAQMLSVPEIPLPLGVIPGIVGVGLAAIAHRRSLHRRKMAR